MRVIKIIVMVSLAGIGFLVLWVFNSFLFNHPKPEITYGEFPFKLTYELNGAAKTIIDTAVCEFKGYGKRSTAGQSREWSVHLLSGNDNTVSNQNKTGFVWITLLDVRQSNDTDALGNKILELYFFGGNGHYYMNDTLGHQDRKAQELDYVNYFYQKSDGTTGHSSLTAEDAWERYKIRLIKWEISPPIQNYFK